MCENRENFQYEFAGFIREMFWLFARRNTLSIMRVKRYIHQVVSSIPISEPDEKELSDLD